MSHPYVDLPDSQYWRTAVGRRAPEAIEALWTPKYAISGRTKIVTAGSCFAQHIGRTLSRRGYHWFDAEPAPMVATDEVKRAFNYGIFSFRTGNIYTTKMLHQWMSWAFGNDEPSDECWETDGRFYDPFRPMIEPNGFASVDEIQSSRRATLSAIRKAVTKSGVFIFTLGLTEAWQNRDTGVEYAICPGTVAGTFNPEKHVFVNHNFTSVQHHLDQAICIMRKNARRIKILLTVSPVPLVATASNDHVLTATTFSKSILRSVAGEAAQKHKYIDYFPSYEIITSPVYGGRFYDNNRRTVLAAGVDFVMENFFRDQQRVFSTAHPTPIKDASEVGHVTDQEPDDDIRCEEEILDALGK